MSISEGLNRSLTRIERRNPWRGSAVRLSLFDSPVALPKRHEPDRPARKDSKLVSLELEAGGLAVELKARNLAGLLVWLSIDAAIAALVQELTQPRQFRTWHGRVAGFIPYDFRKPTLRRVIDVLWAPENPRLFTDTAFGVGWSLNLAQLPRALAGLRRPAGPAKAYDGPKMANVS